MVPQHEVDGAPHAFLHFFQLPDCFSVVKRFGTAAEMRFATDVAGQQEHIEPRFNQRSVEVATLLIIAKPQMNVRRPSCAHRDCLPGILVFLCRILVLRCESLFGNDNHSHVPAARRTWRPRPYGLFSRDDFTPSAGNSAWAVQRMALRIVLRRPSISQFL